MKHDSGSWCRERGGRGAALSKRQRADDRTSALNALTFGRSMVYAMRLPGGIIKIGCSAQLAKRRRSVHPEAEILGFIAGDQDDEQRIHELLVAYRARGHEYYHPTPQVLAVVNEMRDEWNLPHLVA